MTQMNTDSIRIDERRPGHSPDQDDPQTYSIIGAAIEVHRQLGWGFLEAVYQEALLIEFAVRVIPFVRESALPVTYKGNVLKCGYPADFICFGSVIVETKALAELSTVEHAQILNYLKASQPGRGLLLKFGTTRLEFKRFVHTPRER